MGSGFLGNLNHIAFQVPHLKVVRALTILLNFCDIHTHENSRPLAPS